MTERESMKVHGIRVHIKFAIDVQIHDIAKRIGVIDRLLRVQIARQRHADAFSHQRRCFSPASRSNKVQRSKLVFLTPPPPIGNLLEELIELRFSKVLAGGFHRRFPLGR